MTPKPPDSRAAAVPDASELSCSVPVTDRGRIVLGHGSGGRLTSDLIDRVFLPVLGNPALLEGDDSAVLSVKELADSEGFAISTDAHIVHPLFFPGGDIGRLAVCGTVNDLAMVGAVPQWMAASFILEEGFPIADLERVVRSMREAADESGVLVVAGDTKVAERGNVDGLYITTTGVGRIPPERRARGSNIQRGDAVLLSGALGDHGIAVLAARGDLSLWTDVRSDVSPLNRMVEAMFATGATIHALRDPTRGGLASSLNEMAGRSGVAVVLEEEAVPVGPEVEAACEMLGFDPMHVANEGKLVAFVPDNEADRVLAAMRSAPYGYGACRIGCVEAEPAGRVLMHTGIGGTRFVDTPAGELLPRIC